MILVFFFMSAVTLSKTKKKGREHKEAIVNAIKEAVEHYASAYVFTFENMRNQKFKEFRDQLKSSSRYSVEIILVVETFMSFLVILY